MGENPNKKQPGKDRCQQVSFTDLELTGSMSNYFFSTDLNESDTAYFGTGSNVSIEGDRGIEIPRLQRDFGTSLGTITSAVERIWEEQEEGVENQFVVFNGNSSYDHVQLSVARKGLMLTWHTIPDGATARLFQHIEILERHGFAKVAPNKAISIRGAQIDDLECNEFLVLPDGLYAQLGICSQRIGKLCIEILVNIFDVRDLRNVEISWGM